MQVDAVRSTLDGQVYALKTIRKDLAMATSRSGSQLTLTRIHQSVLIHPQHLQLLIEKHIHLCAKINQDSPVPRLFAAFQTREHYYLVMTFAEHGSLWDRMGMFQSQSKPHTAVRGGATMPAMELQWWTSQMVAALKWLHSQGFAHRWGLQTNAARAC